MHGVTIRKEELTATAWSGGTTTQLAIYPKGASYAGRDFVWRVSTASVDVDRSDFTPLPGVARILMVLEGTLGMIYNGLREVTIHRFGQESFSGDWHTAGIGRVSDFNLMTRGGCAGSIETLELLPAASLLHTAEGIRNSEHFTPAAGEIIGEVYYALTDARLTECDTEVELKAGDVYIRNTGRGELSVGRAAEAPTIVVRALVIAISD